MYKKVLINLFFESKKILLMFVLVFISLAFYVTLQTVFVRTELKSNAVLPDFIYTGTIYNSVDGSYPFKAYNEIEGFSSIIRNSYDSELRVYGLTCRSIYNYFDELTKVGFAGRVYGVDDDFFENELKGVLKEGRFPQEGKLEAVVGSYFAKRFNINIGDKIPQTITLNENWTYDDINLYTICGILDDNAKYFIGSAIISRQTFSLNNAIPKENMIFGYFINQNDIDRNKEIFADLNRTAQYYRSPEGNSNFVVKYHSRNKVYINVLMFLAISLMILFLLISYLLKGLHRKIGILKVIGISDAFIFKTFVGGFSIIIIFSSLVGVAFAYVFTSILNNYISEFYGFTVKEFVIDKFAYMLLSLEILVSLFFSYTMVYYKSLKISPKDAIHKP